MNTLPVLPNDSECSGECCTAFSLPYSPEALLAMPEDGLGYRLGHMLIPLGFGDIPRGAGSHRIWEGTPPESYWYTCVHYDRESRRCLNYGSRPSLCSEYPYGHKCQYNGCTQRGDAGVEMYSGTSNTTATVPIHFDGCRSCGRLGQKDRRWKHAGTPLIETCETCNGTGASQ